MAADKQPYAALQPRELGGALGGAVGPHRRRVNSLAWNSTGRKLASGSQDGTVRVWSVGQFNVRAPPVRGGGACCAAAGIAAAAGPSRAGRRRLRARIG
jgi:hypothetical protein